MEKEFVEENFRISQENPKLIAQMYSLGEVLERTYKDNSVILRMRIKRKEQERVENMLNGTAQVVSKP